MKGYEQSAVQGMLPGRRLICRILACHWRATPRPPSFSCQFSSPGDLVPALDCDQMVVWWGFGVVMTGGLGMADEFTCPPCYGSELAVRRFTLLCHQPCLLLSFLPTFLSPQPHPHPHLSLPLVCPALPHCSCHMLGFCIVLFRGMWLYCACYPPIPIPCFDPPCPLPSL